MFVENFFDVTGVDVVSSGENEVLLAIDDSEEAVFVHAGEVAAMEPAIAQHLGRFCGHLPVALHDLWTLNK